MKRPSYVTVSFDLSRLFGDFRHGFYGSEIDDQESKGSAKGRIQRNNKNRSMRNMHAPQMEHVHR